MVSCRLGSFWTFFSASFDQHASFSPRCSKANKKAYALVPNIFPALLSSGNTVIGGNWEKGGHALDDDKRLKIFIILVLLSSSYEEGFVAGHVAGCVFDLLLICGKVFK